MMRIGLFFVFLLFAVPTHAGDWHLSGKIEHPKLENFQGYSKVRVKLISGGAWDTECGETLTEVDGKFSITCSAPWNWLGIKHLAVYHRFDGGKCEEVWFDTISLNDGQVFHIEDGNSSDQNDKECPKDIYL